MDNKIKISDFTLFVPVRDRQYNIPKVLEYYKNLDCKKIIFDSSLEKYDEKLVNEYGFDYVYFDPPINYYEKLNKIFSDYIKTTYVLDCPDDDVALISSLKMCVDFLKNNDDYSCSYGLELGFDKNSIYPSPTTNGCIGGYLDDYKSNDIFDRIYRFLTTNPVQIPHTVIRTKLMDDFFKMIVNNKELQYLNYFEKAQQVYCNIWGNRKVFPIFFRLRNYIDKSNRVHQKFKNELNQGKQFKNHLNEKNLYPLCDEIIKKDGSKTKEECFKFLRLTLEKNFNNHSSYGQGWCTIPIPKNYEIKSILNQDNDIKNFSKIWMND